MEALSPNMEAQQNKEKIDATKNTYILCNTLLIEIKKKPNANDKAQEIEIKQAIYAPMYKKLEIYTTTKLKQTIYMCFSALFLSSVYISAFS